MNKYPETCQTNGYFVHICKSITAKRKIIRLKAKNHLAQDEEKQCGKKPGNMPKTGKEALKTARQKPERTFRHTFGNYQKAPENTIALYRNDTPCAPTDRASGKKAVKALIPLQTGNRKTHENRLYSSTPPLVPK